MSPSTRSRPRNSCNPEPSCAISRGSRCPGASDDDVARFVDAAGAAFPQAGWDIRRRDAVSPQFTRNLERFSQLLTLVALTALVAGGAGVANAVQGLIDRKRAAFAILKALGAPASRVFSIALTQVLLMATLAIFLGLLLGAAIPYVAGEALRRAIELPVNAQADFGGLALGALYGLLVTLVFSLGPLGRAHEIPVAALLRGDTELSRAGPLRYRIAAACAMLALVATVSLLASDKKLAGVFIASVLAASLLLRGVAALVMRAARSVPRARDARLRLAQSNIGRPRQPRASAGALHWRDRHAARCAGACRRRDTWRTRALRHGRNSALLFHRRVRRRVGGFRGFLNGEFPGARIEHVPMMRGRIVAR